MHRECGNAVDMEIRLSGYETIASNIDKGIAVEAISKRRLGYDPIIICRHKRYHK